MKIKKIRETIHYFQQEKGGLVFIIHHAHADKWIIRESGCFDFINPPGGTIRVCRDGFVLQWWENGLIKEEWYGVENPIPMVWDKTKKQTTKREKIPALLRDYFGFTD